VGLVSALLARHHPETPPVLAGSTLPPASPHRAVIKRVTTPRMAGRRATHCSRGPVFGPTLRGDFKSFLIILNFRNCFKLTKFIETCRSVQKLQNKFCWTPLETLFTVGLTKLTFI
jgi:hypothetical protein